MKDVLKIRPLEIQYSSRNATFAPEMSERVKCVSQMMRWTISEKAGRIIALNGRSAFSSLPPTQQSAVIDLKAQVDRGDPEQITRPPALRSSSLQSRRNPTQVE